MDNQEQQAELKNPKLVGGIPLNFEEISKNPEGKAIVKGVSGRKIGIEVKPHKIDVYPIAATDVYFSAKIISDQDHGNFLSFSIRTKELGADNPMEDFYAKKLADEAISYFEKDYQITGIMFDWRSLGDNYKKYFELKRMGKTDQEAALGTWTGSQLAQPHGFTKVEVWEGKATTDPKAEPEMVVRGKFYK